MITFEGEIFPGIHKPVVAEPPTLEVVRTKYFGLANESEIVGKPGGRKISVEILLYSEAWADERDLYDYINTTLDALIGTNGQLIETETCTGEWEGVTFEGFVPDPAGRLPDVGMMLSENKDTVGWFCRGMLHFYQNTPN